MEATILKAEYYAKGDTVRWECRLSDGSPYYMHWPREEYAHAIGVKGKNGTKAVLPAKMIEAHLPDLIGKTYNLMIEIIQVDDDVDKQVLDNINAAMDSFRQGQNLDERGHDVGETGRFYKKHEDIF